MKTIIKLFVILFVVQIGNSQQLVQNISDCYRLEEYKNIFINKPLKNLLNEIKPEIKTVVVFNNETSSILLFNFTTLEQQKKREGALADRLTILVRVKGFLLWDFTNRTKGSELNWTPNDAQNSANFIVKHIEVIPETQD